MATPTSTSASVVSREMVALSSARADDSGLGLGDKNNSHSRRTAAVADADPHSVNPKRLHRSDSSALCRPRKQSRGIPPPLPKGTLSGEPFDADADMQRGQGLLDEPRAYGSNGDGKDEDDDEGDVSGEDVFSDDEGMGTGQGAAAWCATTSSSLHVRPPTRVEVLPPPGTSLGRTASSGQGGEAAYRRGSDDVGADAGSFDGGVDCRGGALYCYPWPPAGDDLGAEGRDILDWTTDRRQQQRGPSLSEKTPLCVRSPPVERDSIGSFFLRQATGQNRTLPGSSQAIESTPRCNSLPQAALGTLRVEERDSNLIEKCSNELGSAAVPQSLPGRKESLEHRSNGLSCPSLHLSGEAAHETLHYYQPDGQTPPASATAPSRALRSGDRTSAENPRHGTFPPIPHCSRELIGDSGRRPFRGRVVRAKRELTSDGRALTAREEKARGIFANLEAQLMEREGGIGVSGASSSSSESAAPSGGSSLTSWRSGRCLAAAVAGDSPVIHGCGGVDALGGAPRPFRGGGHTMPPPGRSHDQAHRHPLLSLHDGIPSRNGRLQHGIIANMDVVDSGVRTRGPAAGKGEAGGGNGRQGEPTRRGVRSWGFGSSRRGAAGAGRLPSREVIASIEADMMRLEEEEERAERAQDGCAEVGRQDHRLGSEGGEPLGSAPVLRGGEAVSMMMVQQPRGGGGEGLADQISTMAIDRLHFQSDTRSLHEGNDGDSSTRSVDSCVSYDGKCTNVYASRARTHDEELACHALNDAICDLYGAPVAKILSRYPTVTRLVGADDETGNVQIHYAVRKGNVKAIRRIIRADPGCALIRNIQGYCPLHFAVQIGNFAAVQLLCSMVPASAEVQCEEGCLPLHEAVSSAAHLPDAPQITAVLINAFPSSIKITNDEGLLPLHLAAMSGFTAGIRTLFAYRFCIDARENTEEMLPLDFAIEGYKTALEEVDEAIGNGRLDSSSESSEVELAEKAMEYRQCIDIFLMSALYDRPVFTPVRSEQQQHQGGASTFLPIHGAVAAQPCINSWKQIVAMYGKDYASEVDVRGRTALHVLVTSALFRLDYVAQMILGINELDPASTTTFDDGGLTPLHAALMHQSHDAISTVVKTLLICNWSTISIEVDEDCDNVEFRGMLPFQLAAARGCGVDVIYMLLRGHPMGVAGALSSKT